MPSGDRAKLTAVERAKRDSRILDLFFAGANYRQIAIAVGLASHASVHRVIQRELAKSKQRRALLTDERVAVYLERTEAMLRAHWPAAMQRDYKSSVIVDRMLARQGRLFALDIVNGGGSLPPTDDPDDLPLDDDADEEGGDELARFRRRRSRGA